MRCVSEQGTREHWENTCFLIPPLGVEIIDAFNGTSSVIQRLEARMKIEQGWVWEDIAVRRFVMRRTGWQWKRHICNGMRGNRGLTTEILLPRFVCPTPATRRASRGGESTQYCWSSVRPSLEPWTLVYVSSSLPWRKRHRCSKLGREPRVV